MAGRGPKFFSNMLRMNRGEMTQSGVALPLAVVPGCAAYFVQYSDSPDATTTLGGTRLILFERVLPKEQALRGRAGPGMNSR